MRSSSGMVAASSGARRGGRNSLAAPILNFAPPPTLKGSLAAGRPQECFCFQRRGSNPPAMTAVPEPTSASASNWTRRVIAGILGLHFLGEAGMASRGDEASELLEAIRSALKSLAPLEEAVNERLDPEHYLALAEAQETLAAAYTRADAPAIAGICAMCGQTLPGGPEARETICGYCERSFGPTDPDE